MGKIKVHCIEGEPFDVAQFYNNLYKEVKLSTPAALAPVGTAEIQADGVYDSSHVEVPALEYVSPHTESVEPSDEAKQEAHHEKPKTKRSSRKPKEETREPEAKEPEVLTEPEKDPASLPDSEFSGLCEDITIQNEATPPPVEEQKAKEEITLPMVQGALKEYGIWAVEQGADPKAAKAYLIAILRKYGRGATGTKLLYEVDYKPVFDAAVARVPMADLDEFVVNEA